MRSLSPGRRVRQVGPRWDRRRPTPPSRRYPKARNANGAPPGGPHRGRYHLEWVRPMTGQTWSKILKYSSE